MEFQQVIESRRSIRAFAADKKVERNVVEELLKGASLAPSWKNSQSARYYVAMTPEMVKAVRECLPAYNQRSSQNAPVLVVTAFEKGNAGFIEGTPSDSLGDAWGCYDLGLHNENFVLAAAERGLGTLIMGLRDEERLAALLGIPESQQVVAVIALGYPDMEPAMPPRKELLQIAKFF
ncbi:MAG: nitroreductase [Lachnospiraceae bacterium]|nr:nitroreductase [Lachnospiraceae bacterium]MCI9150017.1 nitroreductase [Lachnospiraceae bacterium]